VPLRIAHHDSTKIIIIIIIRLAQIRTSMIILCTSKKRCFSGWGWAPALSTARRIKRADANISQSREQQAALSQNKHSFIETRLLKIVALSSF
jgi:hypothetical protein